MFRNVMSEKTPGDLFDLLDEKNTKNWGSKVVELIGPLGAHACRPSRQLSCERAQQDVRPVPRFDKPKTVPETKRSGDGFDEIHEI